MTTFFELPDVLLCSVLSEYLGVEVLARLESALCNRTLNVQFQQLLRLDMFCSPYCDRWEKLKTMWAERHDLKFEGLKVHVNDLMEEFREHSRHDGDFEPGDAKTSLRVYGSKVSHLTLKIRKRDPGDQAEHYVCPVAIWESINRDCPLLQHLSITGFNMYSYWELEATNTVVVPFLLHHRLLSIEIGQCALIPVEVVRALCSSVHLVSLNVHHSRFPPPALLAGTAPSQYVRELNVSQVESFPFDLYPCVTKLTMTIYRDRNPTWFPIEAYSTITHLKLEWSSAVRQDTLTLIATHLRFVQVVDIEGWGAIAFSTIDFMTLINCCVLLERVIIVKCTYRKIDAYYSHQPPCAPDYSGSHLTELSMHIYDESLLVFIVTHCKYLHTLRMYCRPIPSRIESPAMHALHHVRDSSVKVLHIYDFVDFRANVCLQQLCGAHLEELRLLLVDYVTNGCILDLVATLPALRVIGIYAAHWVKSSIVLSLLNNYPNLRSLTFKNANQSDSGESSQIMKMLVQQWYPHLKHFDVGFFEQ